MRQANWSRGSSRQEAVFASHLGFDDLPPFITGVLNLRVSTLCCLLLLLDECEFSEYFLKAVLNCILLLLKIKLA